MPTVMSTSPTPLPDPDWKGRKTLLAVILLSALLGTLAFGLGYLFGVQAKPAPIIIEKCSEVTK